MIIRRPFDSSQPSLGWEEFNIPFVPALDARPWLIALIYGSFAYAIGLPASRYVGIAIIVLIAAKLHFGRSLLHRGAVILLLLDLALWVGLIDEPSKWRSGLGTAWQFGKRVLNLCG
jgi:hypothetical protein